MGDPLSTAEERDACFSREQYEMLLQCSRTGDATPWAEWRRRSRHAPIRLEGLNLYATPDGGMRLYTPRLQEVELDHAHLKGANLRQHQLQRALLSGANLEGADFTGAHLEGADLSYSHLEGAQFAEAHLQGASLWHAYVDASTVIDRCRVDRHTDFRLVNIAVVRFLDVGTRQILEYNTRRMNWEDWYWGHTNHRLLDRQRSTKETLLRTTGLVARLLATFPVRVFWPISDYGLRTWPIVGWFLGLGFLFARFYWLRPESVIVYGTVGELRSFFHALYFSVVTMTTLGFGDIAANPDSWQGQVLLMIQVILGYVLLGALVTRFAVLFTAGGPAGRLAKAKSKREDQNARGSADGG